MPRNRFARLVFALTVSVILGFIARNVYRRYLNTALVAAVKATNVTAVRSLLDRGADPNYKIIVTPNSEDRYIPPPKPVLELAFANMVSPSENPYLKGFSFPNPNVEAIACLLIRKGANTHSTAGTASDYLQQACQMGAVSVVHCLLESGPDLNALDPTGHALDAALGYTGQFGGVAGAAEATPAQRAEAARQFGSRPVLAVSAAQSSEAAWQRRVRTQLVQLLREQGARLTLTQAQKLGDRAAIREIMRQSKLAGTEEGYYALCTAAQQGDLEQMHQLLKAGVTSARPPQADGSALGTPLYEAVANDHVEAVKLLLAHGADPNQQVWYMATPLNAAARMGNFELVKLLLAHGAKIDQGRSYTPLLSAIWGGHVDLARFFLAHGSDPNPKGGFSILAEALHTAPTVAPDLLKYGAKVNPRVMLNTSPGAIVQRPTSPLMNAVWYAPQYEALLRRAGANIGADRSIGCVTAARGGRMDLLPKLLACGVDINGMDADHESALSLCIVHAPDSVRALLEHGADPNAVTQNQRTPLDLAIIVGNTETVRLLLQHGANVNAHAAHTHAALYWARKKNKPDIVALLQRAGARE